MNAYLLLAGILAAIGLYISWTRRIDEGGSNSVHLCFAAALLTLLAGGKYLTMFSQAHQVAALVLGAAGILIYQRLKTDHSRRIPFGLNTASPLMLVLVVIIALFYSIRIEMSLYDGFPVVTLLMGVALLALALIRRQESVRHPAVTHLKESEPQP